MMSLFAVQWLAVITTLDMMTAEHTAYIVLMFVGWFLIAVFGTVVSRRWFPSRLELEQHPDLGGLYAWAWRASGLVRARTDWFRS